MKYAEQVSQSARKSEIQKMELTWAGKLHEKGVELGRREGVELGRREGSLETSRRMLRLILAQRFGTLSKRLARRLDRIDDPERLESISRRALAEASLDEVERIVD